VAPVEIWSLAVLLAVGCGNSRDPTPSPTKPARTAITRGAVGWIDADADHVYFTVPDHETSSTGLARVPGGGGATQTLAVLASPTVVSSFTLDDNTVYLALERHVVNRQLDAASRTEGIGIVSVPKSAAGGAAAPRTLAEGTGLVVDGLAVDDNHVYYGVWLDERRHELRAIPKRGGVERVLHASASPGDEVTPHRHDRDAARGSLLAVDGRHLFWVRHEDHQIALAMFDKVTGAQVSEVTTPGLDPRKLALSSLTALVLFDDALRELGKRGDATDPRTGTSESRLMHRRLVSPDLAIHDELVVLSDRADKGSVVAFDLGADTMSTLVDGEFRPGAVAISAAGIYVVEDGVHGSAIDTIWRFERSPAKK